MSELKCCPFCGGEAELHSVDIGSTTDYFISCKECGCKQSGSISRQAVINAWNERKPMANIVEKLEEKQHQANKDAQISESYEDVQAYGGKYLAFSEAINIVKQEINNGLE